MVNNTQDGVALVVGASPGTASVVKELSDMFDDGPEEVSAERLPFLSPRLVRGLSFTIFKINIQDDKSAQDMVDFVVAKFGRIDYAVDAAGVNNRVHAPIAETDIANFDHIMNINARGNLVCVRAQVAAMLN
ncbi:hypothetical protein F4808DRAFT_461867 [Astrocystis sublimbata]|nr:hypothetical protein F4808DRAFT_461867 [Astrocystis sublimbata]